MTRSLISADQKKSIKRRQSTLNLIIDYVDEAVIAVKRDSLPYMSHLM